MSIGSISIGMQGEIGDEEFKEYFSQYGDIEDSVVSCMSASPLAAFAPSMRASVACRDSSRRASTAVVMP